MWLVGPPPFPGYENPASCLSQSHHNETLRALKDVRRHERLYSRRVGFLTGRVECAYIYSAVTKIEWCLLIWESRHENEQA